MKTQMLCAVAVLSAAITAGAQSPAFDVASVKASNPNPTGPLGATPHPAADVSGRATAVLDRSSRFSFRQQANRRTNATTA